MSDSLVNKGKGFLRLSGLVDFLISVVLLLVTVVALLVGLAYLNVSESLTVALQNSTVYFGMLTNWLDGLAGDTAGTVSLVMFGVFLVCAAASVFVMTRDFAYSNLKWDEAKKIQWRIFVLAVLQFALVGVAVWQIVSLTKNSEFPSDVTFYIAIALTATWLAAAVTKLLAFLQIKNFKVNEAVGNSPAYPYGGNPRGSNIPKNSARGYVYSPNSEPVEAEEPMSKRDVKDAAFDAEKEKLDTLYTTGVIDEDEYKKRLKNAK